MDPLGIGLEEGSDGPDVDNWAPTAQLQLGEVYREPTPTVAGPVIPVLEDLVSRHSSAPVSLIFHNTLRARLTILWVDYHGKEIKYFDIAPESTRQVSTETFDS